MNFAETRGSEGLWCWPSFCHNFLAFIWNAQLINFWRFWISLDFPSSSTVNNADWKRKITVQSLVHNFLPKDDSTSIVLGLFDQRQWRKIGVHGNAHIKQWNRRQHRSSSVKSHPTPNKQSWTPAHNTYHGQ